MVSGMGPEFAVPFAPLEAPQVQVDFDPLEPVEACFLEACDDLWQMEAELARAVLVSVTGVRPEVDLASTAEVLHTEFDIGPEDMSIRPFFPEDFLVLCREVAVHDCMVRAIWASSSWFDLSLRPWIRQAQATAAFPPYLMPISLRGVPAHAWNQRMASVILRGLGFVVGVDDSTARRLDMAEFRVWLRTDRPQQIPRHRMLFIDEPSCTLWAAGAAAEHSIGRRVHTLQYPVRIAVLGEPVLVDGDAPKARLHRRRLRSRRRRTKTLGPHLGLAPVR